MENDLQKENILEKEVENSNIETTQKPDLQNLQNSNNINEINPNDIHSQNMENTNFHVDNETNTSTFSETCTNSEEKDETAETNCLALTVRKDYSLTVLKNGFFTGLRVSWKIAVSTFLLNLLRFLF